MRASPPRAGTSPPWISPCRSRARAWPARKASSPSGTAASSAPWPCAAPSRAGETYIADPPPPLYTTPGTAILSQLAVHPDCRGLGLGERLIDAAEAWASDQGFARLALDTAEPAEALRRRYERRGYVAVGRVQWMGKTYVSVLMTKPLETRCSAAREQNTHENKTQYTSCAPTSISTTI